MDECVVGKSLFVQCAKDFSYIRIEATYHRSKLRMGMLDGVINVSLLALPTSYPQRTSSYKKATSESLGCVNSAWGSV